MAINAKRSLKDRIASVVPTARAEPIVELHIPDGDRGRELVREMSEGFAAAQTLLSERNMYQSRCKHLERELVHARNVAQFHSGEAAYWRAQALNLVKANGSMFTVIKGIEQQFGLAVNVMRQAEAENAQMPKPEPISLDAPEETYQEPVAGMEHATAELFEAVEGAEQSTAVATQSNAAPTPDLAEVRKMARRLAPDGAVKE